MGTLRTACLKLNDIKRKITELKTNQNSLYKYFTQKVKLNELYLAKLVRGTYKILIFKLLFTVHLIGENILSVKKYAFSGPCCTAVLYCTAGCPFFRGFLGIATKVCDSDMIFLVRYQ